MFFVLCFGGFSFLTVLKVEGFFSTLLSRFGFLTGCSIFLFLVYLASETWVGALLEKLSWLSSKPSQVQFHITSRSSTSRFAPWTVFKSQFCGFAAQKYSTKPQLKNCRLARRYVGLKNKG